VYKDGNRLFTFLIFDGYEPVALHELLVLPAQHENKEEDKFAAFLECFGAQNVIIII
jgi:hypothetical protein